VPERRYELTDAQWAAIEELVPARKRRGRKPHPPRAMFNAMMWILSSGAPWRDLPERYGPWQTAYERFQRWRKAGVIDRILERLQLRLDEEGYIDRDLWFVDGTSIRASKAAAGGGKRGGRKSLRITH
jgi:transposase